MSITYSKAQTISELQMAIKSIDSLYNANCCNWSGKTNDTNEYYSEVVADKLLYNLSVLSNIQAVSRNKSYFINSHFPIQLTTTYRNEENMAKRLCGLSFDEIGIILDCQIPIKGVQSDKAGKVDIISFNQENNTLYLIELKTLNKIDTLLKSDAFAKSQTYG